MPIKRKTSSKPKLDEQKGEGVYHVSNWYDSEGKQEDKYEQKRGDILKHPSRILIVGPTGSGKTREAVNLATDIFKWDRLYIFAPQLDQFLLKRLVDYVSKEIMSLGEEPEDYIHTSDKIDITPEDLDPDLQNLIIFDDLVSKYESANNKAILQFAKKGRLRNCSMIILTQSYHDCFPEIRENMNVLSIFEIKNINDKSRIQSTWASDLTKDEFKAIYNIATKKRTTHDTDAFLTIVRDEITNNRRYRRGLSINTLYNPDGTLVKRQEVSGEYPSTSKIEKWRPVKPQYSDDSNDSDDSDELDDESDYQKSWQQPQRFSRLSMNLNNVSRYPSQNKRQIYY